MQLTVSQATVLKQSNSIVETYIPLWLYSTSGSQVMSSSTNSAGTNFLQKGTSSSSTSLTNATHLFTMSSVWTAGQKFAFEASVQANTSGTGTLAIWDCTSNSLVSGSQISTSSINTTVMRSGQFTLSPTHVYAVTGWGNVTNMGLFTSKTYLVALSS